MIFAVERAEAVKDLEKRIEELISNRDADISKALAQQCEEVDFLKAELTCTKVRLHDALSHSQAEKDALIRHADASHAELLKQLESVHREYRPITEAELHSSADDLSASLPVTTSKSQTVDTICNEHGPEMGFVSHNADSVANLWKKLELLRELVEAEKGKWNLQQTGASDSEQLNVYVTDGTVNEVVHSQKIRSSWVVLEEQVIPLIEKFCSAVEQENGPGNNEAMKNGEYVVENQEYGMALHGSEAGRNGEHEELTHLKELINNMQDAAHAKEVAAHEMETKYSELQVELDAVREQLWSQEKITLNFSANVDSIGEQLRQRTTELSEKDTSVQKLSAENVELKEQFIQKLHALQTDCDKKLDSELKTYQGQIDAKTCELLAKCAELEQRELMLKSLSDQCSMLTAERDAKNSEVVNNSSQIDSLTRELSVVREQLNDKTVELHEAKTHVEHERKFLRDETECEKLVLKSKLTELEDEVRTLQQQLESRNIDLVHKGEALTELENRSIREQEEFQAKIAGLEDQLSNDQKSSMEQLDVLRKEVQLKEAAIREHQETHAAYCKLTDTKLADLSGAISAKEQEIKTLLEHNKEQQKTWQEKIDSKTGKLSAKCAELEQRELMLKSLSDQCSMLTAERDAKNSEVMNNSSQIDSLTRELSVVKEQLNDKTVELHEAKTHVEHERKLLRDETECEKLVLKSKLTELEDEIRTLQQQLESRNIDLVHKDEALTELENRSIREQEEFQAKIACLEDQLSNDQKSSVEQLDVLRKEVQLKEAAIREHQETHAAYCKLTDTKLADLSGAISAKEQEIKFLLEHHKTELLELRQTFNEDMAKLSHTKEEQLAQLNSQINELAKNKHDLECESQLLTDKLKSESENVARLKKEVTEHSSLKEECERQLEDLCLPSTVETEHMITVRDEEITALKNALSEKDHSLSLLNSALSQMCHEDVQSLDSSSHTVVTSGDDISKQAEVLHTPSGDADHNTPEQYGEQNYNVSMMVHQINSLGAVNAVLRQKIERLEADIAHLKQTGIEPVSESAEAKSVSLPLPSTASHSSS